jgi:hypothetical protein
MERKLKEGNIDISIFTTKIEKYRKQKDISHDELKKLFFEEQSFIVNYNSQNIIEVWNQYYNFQDLDFTLMKIKKAVFEKINLKKFKKNPEYALEIFMLFSNPKLAKNKDLEESLNLINTFALYFLFNGFNIDRIEYKDTVNSIYETVSNLTNYYLQDHYYDSNHVLLHVFEYLLVQTLSLQKLIQDNDKIVSWLFEKLYEIQEYKKYSGTERNEKLLEAKESMISSFYSYLDPNAKKADDIKDYVVKQNTTMRYLDIIFLIEHSICHKDFHQLADYQRKAFYFLRDMLIASKQEQDPYGLSQIQIHFQKVLDCLVDSYLKFPEFLEYNKSEAEKDSIMIFINHKEYGNDNAHDIYLIKNLNFLCLRYLIEDSKDSVIDEIESNLLKLSERTLSQFNQLKMFESLSNIHKLIKSNDKIDIAIYSACNKYFDSDLNRLYNEAMNYHKNHNLAKIIYGKEDTSISSSLQDGFVLKIYLVLNLLEFIPDPGTDELRNRKHYFYQIISSEISTEKVARKHIQIPLIWAIFTLKKSEDKEKKKKAIVFLVLILLTAGLEENEICEIIDALKNEMHDNAVELLGVIINNLLFPAEILSDTNDKRTFRYKKTIMQGLDFKTKSLLKYMLQSEIETFNHSDEPEVFYNVIRSWDILSFSGLTLATRILFTDFFRFDNHHLDWYKSFFRLFMANKKYFREETKLTDIDKLTSDELQLFHKLIERERNKNSKWFKEYFNCFTHFGWMAKDFSSNSERINYTARDFWSYMHSNNSALICFSSAQKYTEVVISVLAGNSCYNVIKNISLSAYSKLVTFTKRGHFKLNEEKNEDKHEVISVFSEVLEFVINSGKRNILFLGIDEFAKFSLQILPATNDSEKLWIDYFDSIVHIRSIREAFFPYVQYVGTSENNKPFYCFGNSENSINFPKLGYKIWLGLSNKYGKDCKLKEMKDYEKLRAPLDSIHSINNPYPAIKIYSHMTAGDINTSESAILIDGKPYKPEFNENYNIIASNTVWELWGCESAADVKVTSRETDCFSLADYLLDGGAETVLSTLWSVSDFTTSLISEIYTIYELDIDNNNPYGNLKKAIIKYREILSSIRDAANKRIFSELKIAYDKGFASAVKQKKVTVIGNVLADLLNDERSKYFPSRLEFTGDDIASSIFEGNSYFSLGQVKNNVSGESAEIESDLEIYCRKETDKIFDLFLSPEQWGAYIYLAACLKYEKR